MGNRAASCSAPFSDFQHSTAIPGNQQGIDNQTECQCVHHIRPGQITGGDLGGIRIDIPCGGQQGIVVGRDAADIGILKLQALGEKAAPGPLIQLPVDRQQVHGGKIGGGIPAGTLTPARFQTVHALAVGCGQEQGAGEAADCQMQLCVQVDIAGEGLQNGFLIPHNARLDPLRQPGTAVRCTAFSGGVLVA